MTKEELKNKCTERAKIFQQAMESCKSSSLMDCIEWFADRIAELEKMLAEQCPDLKQSLDWANEREKELEKENAELKEQQISLRNERNTFLAQNEQYEKDLIDFKENLTKAKEIISEYVRLANLEKEDTVAIWQLYHKAEQFLNSEVEK